MTFYTAHGIMIKKGEIMIKEAFNMQKEKKYIIQGTIFLFLFLLIYFIVDYLNMTYMEMRINFGTYLVVINITLNIIMALLSTLMMNLSTALVVIKGKDNPASNLGFLSILFGILTYGCTSCVITFFATIGISLSVIALPLAGLPYKFISLVLIIFGLFFILQSLKKPYCKLTKAKSNEYTIRLK